jgi:two-component system chemotaxis response regulator CheY
MRKMIMRTVQQTGLATFEFSEAGDGREALETYDPELVDMLFVDWNMPKMNGFDLVREVRSVETRHTPVVMITTENTAGKMQEAQEEAGVDGYICKPFSAEMLADTLRPLLTAPAHPPAQPAPKKSRGFFTDLKHDRT